MPVILGPRFTKRRSVHEGDVGTGTSAKDLNGNGQRVIVE